MGMGRDPISGDPLGLAFPVYKTPAERIEARIADLDPALSPGRKGEVVAQIVAEEAARGYSAGGGRVRFHVQHPEVRERVVGGGGCGGSGVDR